MARARSTDVDQAGWLIAFVSSIIADIGGDYPNYSWFALAYMFCVIVGVIVAVAADAVDNYQVAIVGFLAAGLVFNTSSANSLIYWSAHSKEAAAAGFILLSMVSVSLKCSTSALYAATNESHRLCGSSTMDRNPQHPTAKPSTLSRFTRIARRAGKADT